MECSVVVLINHIHENLCNIMDQWGRERNCIPSSKLERSTWSTGAASDFESADITVTGKEVDLMDNIHGLEPVYRTVHRALPAYIGLQHARKEIFIDD